MCAAQDDTQTINMRQPGRNTHEKAASFLVRRPRCSAPASRPPFRQTITLINPSDPQRSTRFAASLPDPLRAGSSKVSFVDDRPAPTERVPVMSRTAGRTVYLLMAPTPRFPPIPFCLKDLSYDALKLTR